MHHGPLASVLLLAACRDAERTKPTSGAETLAPTCAANAVIPAVLDCTFASATSGAGAVEYWLAEEPSDVRTTPPGPVGTAHDLAVMGLKAGRTYEYRAVVDAGDHRVTSPVGSHTVPEVPADFAQLTLTASDPERSEIANGYVIVSIAHITAGRFSEVLILDGEGDVVWWVRSVENGLSVTPTLSRDGRSLRFLTTDQTWATDLGLITRYALDGDEVEETRAQLGHHAMIENSDETLSWISFVYAEVGGQDWAADAIRTVAEGSGEDVEPLIEFSWFEDYGAEPWEAVPGRNDEVRYGEGIEWTHTNSLMAHDDESFFVNAKNVDKILKIDRQSGEIVWQLNGAPRDLSIPRFTHPDGSEVWRAVDDLDLFSQSHMSHLWDGGMVVFDNGDLSHDPPFTRAVEYAYDEEALTIEQVWEYVEPDLRFTGAMGDVRKLESGNYLIAWSGLEYVNEVTPEGETVWQIEMANVGTFGRVLPLADLYPPSP